MATLTVHSPLAGWALPRNEIPDPAFAQGVVGDGLGIDPTGDVVHAPCAGVVQFVPGHRHALSLRVDGGAVLLLHVGIDTVALGGAGFEALVADGARVQPGQPLLRFDLDLLARRAPSLVTPVLLTEGGRVSRVHAGRLVAVGDVLMEIEMEASAASAGGDAPDVVRSATVRFAHGLHARPAAQLVAAIKSLDAQVALRVADRTANARSTVALLSLGVQCGDRVEIRASGEQADAAVQAVVALLEAGDAEQVIPASATASAPVTTPVVPAARTTGMEEAGAGTRRSFPALVASRGLALGPAAFLTDQPIGIAPPGGPPAHEHAQLEHALARVAQALQASTGHAVAAAAEIAQAHLALLQDPELQQRAQAAIDAGASAGQAWHDAVAVAVDALGQLQDARLRERIADLRDIERQVLAALSGHPIETQHLPVGAIVVADDLLPSQLLALDRRRLAGLCMARGGPTSHVAIIAAALGLPTVVGAGPAVLGIEAGTVLWLDAEQGVVQACASDAERLAFERRLDDHRRRHTEDLARAGTESRTSDGERIAVLANLGDSGEGADALALGAEGCGLLRTEFLFLHRDTAPGEDEQLAHYQRLQDALGDRPLVIRTMDVGGDKPLPYFESAPEDNPALGLRGIRASLARPDLLRTQLRAVLRLAGATPARLLLPMVNDAAELRAVRVLLRTCADELGVARLPALGAMVETPAAALGAAALLRDADFLSIGSNDLAQYVLAIDRGHAVLGARLDGLHPAVLRLIGEVASAGAAAGKPVAVCGGLASDVQALPILLGLGVHSLSAVPQRIPELKRVLRELDLASCRALAQRALAQEDAAGVRGLCAPAAPTTVEAT